MSPNPLVPELPLLQAAALNLLQPAQAAVQRFTLDVLDRLERPVLLCDYQGRCLFRNASFTALNDGEVVLAELDFAGRELKRILDLSVPVLQFRDCLIVAGGTKVPVLLDIHPLANERGQRLGSAVLVTDLRHRLTAKTAWHYVCCAMDVVNAGVIGLTPEGEITAYNRSARMLLGLGDIDVTGMPLEQVLENIEVDPKPFLSLLTGDGSPKSQTFEWHSPAGRRLRVESPYVPGAADTVIVFHDMGGFSPGRGREIGNRLGALRPFIEVWHARAMQNGFEGFDDFAAVVTRELDAVNSIITEFFTEGSPAEDDTNVPGARFNS